MHALITALSWIIVAFTPPVPPERMPEPPPDNKNARAEVRECAWFYPELGTVRTSPGLPLVLPAQKLHENCREESSRLQLLSPDETSIELRQSGSQGTLNVSIWESAEELPLGVMAATLTFRDNTGGRSTRQFTLEVVPRRGELTQDLRFAFLQNSQADTYCCSQSGLSRCGALTCDPNTTHFEARWTQDVDATWVPDRVRHSLEVRIDEDTPLLWQSSKHYHTAHPFSHAKLLLPVFEDTRTCARVITSSDDARTTYAATDWHCDVIPTWQELTDCEVHQPLACADGEAPIPYDEALAREDAIELQDVTVRPATGGCVCALAPSTPAPPAAPLLALGLFSLVRRRRKNEDA